MTINHFARHIGLSRSEGLYQIKRGNNGISRKLTELVVAAFPQINDAWLISGRGEMFVCAEEQCQCASYTEFYDADVELQIQLIDSLEPATRLILPQNIEAEFAMVYRGGAMDNTIPANSVVFLKEADREAIILGTEHLVVSSKIVALRVVRRASDDLESKVLRLVASQSDKYDDIFIGMDQIDRIYKVVAKLIVNR